MSADTLVDQRNLRRAVLRHMPPWWLIVALAAFARAVQAGKELLNDPDTYLHVAAGRWMLANGALPSQDPLSHSLAGASWVVHEWLSELLLAATYDGFGWSGLIILTAVCFAVSLALLMRQLQRHLDPLVALLATALGALMVLPHLLARPHLLALPLLVMWCGTLITARDGGRGPPLALLPVMTLWANLHGGFMVGVALVFYLGLEAVFDGDVARPRRAALRQWGGFALLTVGAATLTPNGIAGLLLPFHISGMTVLQSNFQEWMSPDFHVFQPLEIWLLGAIFLGFAGLKLPLARLLLLIALFHFALAHQRHADLLAMLGPLVVAAPLAPQFLARLPSLETSALRRILALGARPASGPAIALTLGAGAAIALLPILNPVQRGDDPVTPATALATAMRVGLAGPVFNSEPFGGYLTFRGVPTFIDGRIEMYGDAFLSRYLQADRGDEASLVTLLEDYRVTWTLLDPRSAAVQVLDHLGGWRRVYADDFAVVHRRVDALRG